jgi:hypothetical protein
MAVFKSLIASALLIMPAAELRYFPDTLEWVSNPDTDTDADLFADIACRVYAPAALESRSWTSLARRVDDEANVPYLLYFLGRDRLLLQVHVPLCLRDEDLDGRPRTVPERALAVGQGHGFREARCTVLPLTPSPGRRRPILIESAQS